jgi:UDP-N-acetylglucosamine 2-epimerase (non-hydrolysing)
MSRSLIYLVAGARPNFMKIAPIVRALQARADRFEFRIIHTGQHYDREMSDVFFDELGIPKPDYHLEAGGGSHATQTAKIMVAFEEICQKARPDCVLVVGDVNSTLACSIDAKKLDIPVAHVEAGLRSGDMRMPEEINRLVTDSISDWFFCTEPAGVATTCCAKARTRTWCSRRPRDGRQPAVPARQARRRRQGRHGHRGHQGPVPEVRRGHPAPPVQRGRRSQPARHRRRAQAIAADLPLIFPVHPRTRGNLEKFGLDLGPNVVLTKPQSYMEFLNLWKDAALILTDSGGLQEETTALGVPCLTLRENTERPVTIDEGSNVLVGTDPARILEEAAKVLAGQGKQGRRPALWDGKAAERIVAELDRLLA